MSDAFYADQPTVNTTKGVRLGSRPDAFNEAVPTWIVWFVLGGFGAGLYLVFAGNRWPDALAKILFFAVAAWMFRTGVLPRLRPLMKDTLRACGTVAVVLWRLALLVGVVSLVFTKPMTAIALALIAIAILLGVMVLQRSQ
jgi:hypothetical protein